MSNHYAGPTGRLRGAQQRLRRRVRRAGSAPARSGTATYYSYTLDDPNTVKAIVTAGAGAGKI